MRGSRRSLLRQASVLIVLCCAFAIGASQALAQDPAPEPAPKLSGPKPEAPPSAKRQLEQPATRTTPPPAPPRATPPPPAATNPPPPAVTPPPAPALTRVVSQPPPASAREGRAQEKPKPRNTKPKQEQKVTQTAAPALPRISREEATSPDTLLMVGGLALFFLVLADMVFLTLSTRVLRTR
jgi:hypothetical protein